MALFYILISALFAYFIFKVIFGDEKKHQGKVYYNTGPAPKIPYTRPLDESILILLSTLPQSRQKFIFKLLDECERISGIDLNRDKESAAVFFNMLKCDDLVTSLQLYCLASVLPLLVAEDRKVYEVLNSVACDDIDIFLSHLDIMHHKDQMEKTDFIGEYKGKLYYSYVETLISDTGIKMEEFAMIVPGSECVRLNPELEMTIELCYQILHIEALGIVQLAFDNKYAKIPFDAVVDICKEKYLKL
jgi:hypothetical protein